jgi:hypothetical protein
MPKGPQGRIPASPAAARSRWGSIFLLSLGVIFTGLNSIMSLLRDLHDPWGVAFGLGWGVIFVGTVYRLVLEWRRSNV